MHEAKPFVQNAHLDILIKRALIPVALSGNIGMIDTNRTFGVASEDNLAELIRRAQQRLVVICPAVTDTVAKAIAERLDEGLPDVTVILDADPEVYRLGYGTEPAFDLLREAAYRNLLDLRIQRGIRIGVVVCDGVTMVFAPVPLLIEAGSTAIEKPNAIVLSGAAVEQLAEAAGAGSAAAAARQEIGMSALEPADAQAVKADLTTNPPQQFDIARTVRVFNAAIEIAELELVGTQIQRQTISLSKTIFAAIDDDETKKRISAAYTLIDPAGALSGRAIARKVDELRRIALKPIPGFGQTIRRIDRQRFEEDLRRLQKALVDYQQEVKNNLQSEIQKSKEALIKALVPTLLKNPPRELFYGVAGPPDEGSCDLFYDENLKKATRLRTN
jgi:hypothetical protein